MRINKFSKNIIITSMVFGAMVLNGTTSSKAVLQSNGNDGATYNLNDWMVNVRKMEELGGAMGLSETLNSNLTSSSDSNNIDVHMQKNTEYGALAILSASSYGNPNKVNDGETTTGNVTGVVMKFNYEWVANFLTVDLGFPKRYINEYNYWNYVARKGDATFETKGWHESQNLFKYTNLFTGTIPTGFVRATNAIFSYVQSYKTHQSEISHISSQYRSRAVIVQGEGI